MSASGATAHRANSAFTLVLAAMSAVGPLSIDMYLPSLPALAGELHGSLSDGQATVAVFFSGLAVGQLFYGPVSDRYGRRAPLLFGFALFAAASVVAGLAADMPTLIVARLVQAIGACAGMVVTRAIVRDHFDHKGSAGFFSLLMLVTAAAPILAPSVGSLILNVAGWRAIFGVLAAFGAAVFVSVLFMLPESRSEEVAAQARSEHPFRAYLSLLTNRRLLGYLLAGALNSACMFTYIACSAAVIMGVYGVSPPLFGLLFGINSVGLIGGSQLNRLLLRRFSPDQVLAGAAVASVLCAGTVILAASLPVGVAPLIMALFVTIASSSLVQANSLAGALAAAGPRPGSASALFGAGGFGLGAVTSTIAGAMGSRTALPMALVIAACLLACAASLFGLALRPSARGAVA